MILIPCNFLDCTSKIEIFTGCAKTKDLWEKNNRPRNVKLFILESKIEDMLEDSVDADGYVHYIRKNITVIDEQYATLKDIFDWQEIPLDRSKFELVSKMDMWQIDDRVTSYYYVTKNQENELNRPGRPMEEGYFYFLGIQILSVYEGTKYQDTCISEVRFEYR